MIRIIDMSKGHLKSFLFKKIKANIYILSGLAITIISIVVLAITTNLISATISGVKNYIIPPKDTKIIEEVSRVNSENLQLRLSIEELDRQLSDHTKRNNAITMDLDRLRDAHRRQVTKTPNTVEITNNTNYISESNITFIWETYCLLYPLTEECKKNE